MPGSCDFKTNPGTQRAELRSEPPHPVGPLPEPMARSSPSSDAPPSPAEKHFLPAAPRDRSSQGSPGFVTSLPAPPPSSTQGEEVKPESALNRNKLSDSLNLVTGQAGGGVSDASSGRRSIFCLLGERRWQREEASCSAACAPAGTGARAPWSLEHLRGAGSSRLEEPESPELCALHGRTAPGSPSASACRAHA